MWPLGLAEHDVRSTDRREYSAARVVVQGEADEVVTLTADEPSPPFSFDLSLSGIVPGLGLGNVERAVSIRFC